MVWVQNNQPLGVESPVISEERWIPFCVGSLARSREMMARIKKGKVFISLTVSAGFV